MDQSYRFDAHSPTDPQSRERIRTALKELAEYEGVVAFGLKDERVQGICAITNPQHAVGVLVAVRLAVRGLCRAESDEPDTLMTALELRANVLYEQALEDEHKARGNA